MQVAGTDPLQIINSAKAPILVFLFLKISKIHQEIDDRNIAVPIQFGICRCMYFLDQFFIIHFQFKSTGFNTHSYKHGQKLYQNRVHS